MRLFKSDWVDWVLTTLKVPDDVPIENKRVTNSIASAQAQVESQNFDSRKNVLKYDDVMNRQREVVYGERRAVLEGADLHEQVRDDDRRRRRRATSPRATDGFPEEWDLEALWTRSSTLYPVTLTLEPTSRRRPAAATGSTASSLVEELQADAQAAYDAREAEFGDEVMRELERRVLLSVLDRKWREHLYEMDYLREGIGLRAYSQRDPLVEYQREGFDMFARDDGRHQGGVGRLPVQPRGAGRRGARGGSSEAARGADRRRAWRPGAARRRAVRRRACSGDAARRSAPRASTRRSSRSDLTYTAPSEDGDAEVSGAPQPRSTDDPYAGICRNALCPCGSGKKYKKCHGAPGGPTGLTTRVNG